MTTANDIITRALKLINVPGRGASLKQQDLTEGLDTLIELIDSEAISQSFIPGVNRHFFALTPNKSIYTYGPGGDFDTELAFDDPVPSKIEDAYVRSGSSITSNQLVSSANFAAAADWTLGTGWSIGNQTATIAAGNDTETMVQTGIAVETAKNYKVVIEVVWVAGAVTAVFSQSGGDLINTTIDSTGTLEYNITAAEDDLDITFTANATADLVFSKVSIVEVGKSLTEMPDGVGSDYPVAVIDSAQYNRQFTKGVSGRPYRLLFSRSYPLAELRLDDAGASSDILVMDVLVNKAKITRLSQTIALHPEAMLYLRYQLANLLAGEYGKTLRQDQYRILLKAEENMAAPNTRPNKLIVDGALLRKARFDINRGDY